MSQQTHQRKPTLPPAAIAAIAMAVVGAIALYIRIALPWDQVFHNGQIWFLETDSYFYMRNIEVIVQHFPHFNSFDPYMLFPFGQAALIRPFFAGLISAVILLARGATALYHMEAIAAFVPPVLGALTLIPVYFIGKELFNRWVGVIGALVVAILPTEFLHRSLLGFTDHHVAEVLFSTTAALFVIMAVKRARAREMTFEHVLKRDWSVIRRPLIYVLLAGIFLGFYLLSWQGGLYFIFIIFAYLVIQFVIDHMRRQSGDYLCIIGTPLFLIAFLMLLPVLTGTRLDTIYRISLTIAVLAPVALSFLSRFMAGRNLKPVYYLLALLGLLGIGLAALYASNPSLFGYMFSQFNVFTPAGARLTIMEVHPLNLQILWSNFNMAFFFSFIFIYLIYVAFKEKSAEKGFFVVWTVITLMATFGQRRFGYYYAINASLLTGYFAWKMLDLVGLRKLFRKPKEAAAGKVKKLKKKTRNIIEHPKRNTFMQPRGAWINVIIVGVVLFFLIIFPSTGKFNRAQPTPISPSGSVWFAIGYTPYIASLPNQIMTADWYSSLEWLRQNSPDPFGNPDFYYDLYPPQKEFVYPSTAYGVMSWWDYGYFTMQIGHRIPNANPTQANASIAGEYFTAENETAANQIADKMGTKYVAIDYLMATTAKFYAMAEWAGLSSEDFYGIYYIPPSSGQTGGQFAYLFYATYYESVAARLYNFDGKAQAGKQPIVISYEDKVTSTGFEYRAVTSANPFTTYEQAQAYLASQTTGNWRIVGTSPFTSIVSLEAMSDYQLVYTTQSSNETIEQGQPVKIFEYLGAS